MRLSAKTLYPVSQLEPWPAGVLASWSLGQLEPCVAMFETQPAGALSQPDP